MIYRCLTPLFLGISLITSSAVRAHAQPPPALATENGPTLLTLREVQKELNLSESQMAKVPDAVRTVSEDFQKKLASLLEAPKDERFQKLNDARRAMTDKVKQAVMLDDKQNVRFDQIALQLRGPDAFNDLELLKKLSLTADQRTHFGEVRVGFQNQMRTARENSIKTKDRIGFFAQSKAIRRSTTQKLVDILTPEQKATWTTMTGPPFELTDQDLPRRREP